MEWAEYLWIRLLHSRRAGHPKAGWQVGALKMYLADMCPHIYWGFYIKKRITLWNRPSARIYVTSLPFTQVYSKHTHNNKQQTKLEEVQSWRVSVCGGQAGSVLDSGDPKSRRQGVCDPAVENRSLYILLFTVWYMPHKWRALGAQKRQQVILLGSWGEGHRERGQTYG